jgi:N-acyl-D-amino-acid deacylase
MTRQLAAFCLGVLLYWVSGCAMSRTYDVLIRNGLVYDGSGSKPVRADVAIDRDEIKAVGDLHSAHGRLEMDVAGLAVAPGFINMLSWADEPLLIDGRGQSDVRQGVTLEIFGEGTSMGPLNPQMKDDIRKRQGDLKYDVAWTTLGEYLEHLERQGVSPNIASFVGATTVRIHEIGYADRAPTPEELQRMRMLVRDAMREGALGVGASLIYSPAIYSKTDELVALSEEAAAEGGLYIAHIRNEGDSLLEAVDELIEIARRANIPAEIYHIKASGRPNWSKMSAVHAKVEAARAQGLHITADMYSYNASATGLDATMPPWVQEGGLEKWIERLKDPAVRERVRVEMVTPTTAWDNTYVAAGSPDKILLVGFRSDALKPLTGKTLAEVAKARGKSPEDTAMDLVIEDESNVGAVYFTHLEENVRRNVTIPWVSFCSDAGAYTPEGVFLKSQPHPRAYGAFARLLGKYVREEKLLSLEEAIRRMTSLPAENIHISRRGSLKPGYYADVVVFDPATIIDRATFTQPHQYAVGVKHVLVNGVPVVRDGEHTGAKPGRVVRGPGWRGTH